MIDTANKYKAKINNMFFKGDAVFGISCNEGKYEMEIELDGADFEMQVVEASVEDNVFTAKASTPILPDKDFDILLTFEDDKCNGYLKIPFVGKVKIKDAVKI